MDGMLVGSDVCLPPAGIRPDGLAGCAQTGAEIASAAITAMPVKRCFIPGSSLWVSVTALSDKLSMIIIRQTSYPLRPPHVRGQVRRLPPRKLVVHPAFLERTLISSWADFQPAEGGPRCFSGLARGTPRRPTLALLWHRACTGSFGRYQGTLRLTDSGVSLAGRARRPKSHTTEAASTGCHPARRFALPYS